MRVLVGITAWCALLACSGVATPEAPPLDDPGELPPLPPPRLQLVTWSEREGACFATLAEVRFDAVTPSTELGSVQGPCASRAWAEAAVVQAPSGDAVLLTVSGVAALGGPGRPSQPLPPAPEPWRLEGASWDASGALRGFALWAGASPAVTSTDDGDRYLWDVDGDAVVYLPEGWVAGVDLCADLTLRDGAWTRDGMRPVGVSEGTSAPWCDPNEGLAAPLPGPGSGGHGVFLGPADAPGAPDDRDWLDLGGPFASFGSEVLEGQDYETPLAWTGAAPWTVIDGFEEPGHQLALWQGAGLAIACREGHAALITLDDAPKVIWTGAFCPVLWPAG